MAMLNNQMVKLVSASENRARRRRMHHLNVMMQEQGRLDGWGIPTGSHGRVVGLPGASVVSLRTSSINGGLSISTVY